MNSTKPVPVKTFTGNLLRRKILHVYKENKICKDIINILGKKGGKLMKKKISLMIAVILILQVLLPMLTVIWESGFTIKSVAVTSGEWSIRLMKMGIQ